MSSPRAKANPGVEQFFCSAFVWGGTFGGAELLQELGISAGACSLSRCHQQSPWPWLSFHSISFPTRSQVGSAPLAHALGQWVLLGFALVVFLCLLGHSRRFLMCQKIPNQESVTAVALAHTTSPDHSEFHQSWPYFISQPAKLPTLSVHKPQRGGSGGRRAPLLSCVNKHSI